MSCACCGFIYALDTASSMIQSGRYKKVIVCSAEKMSSVVDWTDRQTCVLFGDGAGAVLVEATEEEGVGFQDSMLLTDGKGLPFLHMKLEARYARRPISPLTIVCTTSIKKAARCSATR